MNGVVGFIMSAMIGLLLLCSGTAGVAQSRDVRVDQEQFARLKQTQIKIAESEVKTAIALNELKVKYREAQISQALEQDKHRMYVFYNQAYFSIVLTVFVILIVTAGIYLSYLQFKSTTDGACEGQPKAESPVTRFLLSKEGFELSSSIIGLFVLLASMFFFYLYIKEVYPIREVVDASSPAAAQASTRPTEGKKPDAQ